MVIDIEQVNAALARVTHPALGNDIVSLNMVSDIIIKGHVVSFTLTFQKSTDPLITSIQKACKIALQTHISPHVEIGEIKINSIQTVSNKEDSLSKVKNIIAVASGKGGVGKSTITVNVAIALETLGYKVGLIDADIYGPSIPKMFHVEDSKPEVVDKNERDYIIPIVKNGIKLLSVGFFVNPTDALIWRGPMATNALRQLIHNAEWGELDYLMIDMPPGTGDIHLTMIQEASITGVVIVSTPQQVALADAIKSMNMFKSDKINVPILGLVENMAWFTPEELPNNRYFIFGKEGCKKLAESTGTPFLGQIPMIQSICEDADNGVPSALIAHSPAGSAFIELAKKLIIEVDRRNKMLDPTRRIEIIKKMS